MHKHHERNMFPTALFIFFIFQKERMQFSSLKNYAEFRNLPHILRIEDWNVDAIEMVRWFLHPQTYLEMLFAKILRVILRDWMH